MSQIIPFLWFDTNAEEAVNYYVSIFKKSKIDNISRYGDSGPMPAGTAMVIEFQLEGQDFMAINGGTDEFAKGNGRVNLFISCETQDDVDAYWEQLQQGGKILQCGWLTDKYGITWNIVPQGLGDLLGSDDRERADRAMRAMLEMEKLDINELRRAYEGVPG